MNQRMNREKLNIGAYWLQPYAGSEEQKKACMLKVNALLGLCQTFNSLQNSGYDVTTSAIQWK